MPNYSTFLSSHFSGLAMPPQSAEASFRSNLAGFKWAQGVTDDSRGAASEGSNPFSRFTNSLSGYIPLRSGERTNEEEAYYALSRWERFLGFLLCCAGASVCFLVAFLTLPFIVLKPRKFAVAFSMGSLLFMIGFGILSGPVAHLKHLFSKERIPFTGAYFGSLGLTLYFSLGAQSYMGTLVAAVVQVAALLAYFMAYFPGGMTTLRFAGSMGLRGASSLLPV